MVYRILIAASMIVTLLAQFARTQARTDPALDKLAVEFEAAFKAKDAAKVASFYAEDAVMMPPNEPTLRGERQSRRTMRTSSSRGSRTWI